MEDKLDVVIIFMLIIAIITWFLSFIALPNLEKRIDDLEKQSKEAHEYILNRIGG